MDDENFKDLTLISTRHESCFKKGNLEITTYEDANGNIIKHVVDQDGGEWWE